MEGVPKFLDYTDVMQTFLQIPGVVRVHNLRIWALSINKIALAAHLAVGTYIYILNYMKFVHAMQKHCIYRGCHISTRIA